MTAISKSDLIEAMLRLPTNDRADVASKLLLSLEPTNDSNEDEAALHEDVRLELEHRLNLLEADLAAGKAGGRPWREVLDEVMQEAGLD